jgi:peptidoglycan L-alanyl-D-glutamate endopeptidase CwlK
MNVTESLTNIELLEFRFKKKVQAFLADLMRERIYVVVLETYRTPARQKYLYDKGKSKTTVGKHPKGLAIDIAPVGAFRHGRVRKVTWDTKDPVWKKIAEIANIYGIAWGGNWSSFPDYVHFEEVAND